VDSESTILQRRIEWRKDDPVEDVHPVLSAQEFGHLQQLVEREIYIDKAVLDYISTIVRGTRQHPKVEVGSSPRGGLALLRASRAIALILGRDFVTPDDVKLVAVDALAHRLILNVEEALEGLDVGTVVREVVDSVPVPTQFVPR
jgi:MoxR-like ATPase